MYKKYKSAL